MGEEETPEDAEMKELVEIRDRLQKMIQGANLGSGEQPSAEELAGHGAGAFEQDTSAAKPGYSPDKAPQGDTTNVAGTNVTGHQNNIQVGGEITPTAPTAKASYDHTLSEHREAHAGLSKSLGDDAASWIMKSLSDVADAVVEKNTELTQDIVVAAVEKMLEEQHGSSATLQKSIDSLGAAYNDVQRQLAESQEALVETRGELAKALEAAGRIERLEKAAGISQSGARGAVDSTVASPKQEGGLWSPLFKGARDAALGKY